jgi:hypothetical protein
VRTPLAPIRTTPEECFPVSLEQQRLSYVRALSLLRALVEMDDDSSSLWWWSYSWWWWWWLWCLWWSWSLSRCAQACTFPLRLDRRMPGPQGTSKKLIVFGCGHVYHEICLVRMLEQQVRQGVALSAARPLAIRW